MATSSVARFSATQTKQQTAVAAAAATGLGLGSPQKSVVSSVDNENRVRIWHWNVNGLKLVLKRNTLQRFLQHYNPSILCLNETKLTASDVPSVRKQLKPFFSHMHFACCTTRKNYGGVAIFYNEHKIASKLLEGLNSGVDDPEEERKGEVVTIGAEDDDQTIICGITEDGDEDHEHNREGRVIAKVFSDFVLVSVYTPHSGVGDLKRLEYRVEQWDRAFEEYIQRLKQQTGKPVIVCGDLNIIRHEQDIYNSKSKDGRPGLTDRERDSFESILENC